MMKVIYGRLLQTIGIMVAAGLGGLCSFLSIPFASGFPIFYLGFCLLIGLLLFYWGSNLVRSANSDRHSR
jgi:hypothetical protein